MKRASLLIVLGGIALAASATVCQPFARGDGRAWRGAVPSAPSVTVAVESPRGALSFDAVTGAESYLVYLYEKPVRGDEKFWTGSLEGFIAGLEITPREGAKRFTVVDPNARIGWGAAYVFAVESKSRRLLSAKWTEGAKEAGEDGCVLGDKYRAARK